MNKILPADTPLKQQKQKFINSLEKLDAKEVYKLLSCNILKYFERDGDANFCPYQIALIYFNEAYEKDAIVQPSLHDRYRNIINMLLRFGADMNKVVNGKSVLTYELPSKLYRFNKKTHFWVVKQAILHGMYSLDGEEDESVKCCLKAKGKRLETILPFVFILYCFKQRQIKAML